MKYETPIIEINAFNTENIVTSSCGASGMSDFEKSKQKATSLYSGNSSDSKALFSISF